MNNTDFIVVVVLTALLTVALMLFGSMLVREIRQRLQARLQPRYLHAEAPTPAKVKRR